MARDRRLNDLEVDGYLADSVEVFPETINEEFVRVPADIAYWTHKLSEATRRHLRAKLNTELREAKLRMEVRARLEGEAPAKGGRVTEASVDAAVVLEPGYEEVKIEEIEAEAERVRLQGVVRAVETKGQMVKALGEQILSEKRTNPALREMSRDTTTGLPRRGHE